MKSILGGLAFILTGCLLFTDPRRETPPGRERLSRATVEVRHDHRFCAGVFVSTRTVRTAAHCTTGQGSVKITDFTSRTATCERVNRDDLHDLAWCDLPDDYRAPDYVTVGVPERGARVTVIQHMTAPWDRTPAYVKRFRPVSDDFELSVDAIPGWSGSPVFDEEGNLVCTVVKFEIVQDKIVGGPALCSTADLGDPITEVW